MASQEHGFQVAIILPQKEKNQNSNGKISTRMAYLLFGMPDNKISSYTLR